MSNLSDYFERSAAYHQYTIVNPGAETGDMTGWTASVGTGLQVTTVYGGGHTGSYHFWGDQQLQSASYQDIPAVAGGITTNMIDSGKVILKTQYWGMSYQRYDMSKLQLTFYDESAAQITDTINLLEGFTPKRTQPNWIPLSWFYFMLPGTRTIRMTMENYRINGSYCDGHMDDLELHGYVLS